MSLQKHIISIFILFTSIVFSQETIKHNVVKGETIYSLAKKYQVEQEVIFEENPKAKEGLQIGMTLQIPNKKNRNTEEKIIHEVLPKETLFGISKKYNVSIDKIKEANTFIDKEGLKIGAKLIIPSSVKKEIVSKVKVVKKESVVVKKESKSDLNVFTEEVIHEVLPKETKYGISKKYGISIAELESLNPEIKSGLEIGYKLLIKKGAKKAVIVNDKKKDTLTEKATVQVNTKPVEETPKEIKEASKKEDKLEKPSSQFKIIAKVESDKNDEIIVKPQIEEENEAVPEIPVTENVEPLSEENLSKADFLIGKASENIGVPYRSGGTTNAGFDCSGLMINTFALLDMKLPRSSRDMAKYGTRIDRKDAQKGDLIFFTTMGGGRVSHVGMIVEVEEEEIKFIHSSTQAGVIVSSTNEAYYAKRFVQVNRVLE